MRCDVPVRRCLVAVLLCALFVPSAAFAQDEGSVLLVLDSSKSMSDAAGAGGGTRLDAAKAAVRELVDTLPAEAKVGVRVYGAKVEESGRAAGCADTELVVPVGPLDKRVLRSTIDGLQGKGRTPIGRSLLAAPEDLPPGGRRTLILVSDGGDNCAPPDPCRAAREVAKQGVEMTIQVVGLQVNERVREQLRCIADAGGGTYVDAADPEALKNELLAAFARALRLYEPRGTPVDGGAEIAQAVPIGPGLYLDSISGTRSKWYSVQVERGQRLAVSATAVPPAHQEGQGGFGVEIVDAQGDYEDGDRSALLPGGLEDGRYESVSAVSALAGGENESFEPGTVRFRIEMSGDISTEIPVEIGVGVLDPGERPAFQQRDGPLPKVIGTGASPTPTARPQATPGRAAPGDDGPDLALVAAVGLGGVLLGGAGGLAATRGRRA